MTDVCLFVIEQPDPETAMIFSSEPQATPTSAFTASGDVNLLCGQCDFAVAEGMRSASQLSSRLGQFVIQCARCGAYNITRT